MCGVHPYAEFIVDEIGRRLRDNKKWKPFLKEIKGYDITIEKYHFSPDKSIRRIHSDIKKIMGGLIKKIDKDRFMGFFIFPDSGRLHISEVALLNIIGSMAGDIFIEETGWVATRWYAPRSWVSAKHSLSYELPGINIMMIEGERHDEDEEIPIKKRRRHAKKVPRK
ncbi:hypothetical protein COV19_03415 [Candidatus Woesearchaeota archaeon CG10_big_fil_rev_8_21_14_0_10_44_13]|nr:MAG: hypothetical protein COV19_03415 [Candidatus Woesearchaeota archaeon CG10_big_fil_rev_8_21_14_0_10_44_13]